MVQLSSMIWSMSQIFLRVQMFLFIGSTELFMGDNDCCKLIDAKDKLLKRIAPVSLVFIKHCSEFCFY